MSHLLICEQVRDEEIKFVNLHKAFGTVRQPMLSIIEFIFFFFLMNRGVAPFIYFSFKIFIVVQLIYSVMSLSFLYPLPTKTFDSL